jgi:hypothetical protein
MTSLPGVSAVSSEPIRITEPLKFGEVFKLDLRATNSGVPAWTVKLERIPMELLFLPLEMQGQLVTREELARSGKKNGNR